MFNTTLSAIPKVQFKDFDIDFRANPKTNDILSKSSSESIRQSIRNLMLTNFYERPFRVWLGTNIRGTLFELIGPESEVILKREVLRVIATHERRVADVECKVVYDINSDDGIRIKLQYTEIGLDVTTNLEILLQRDR